MHSLTAVVPTLNEQTDLPRTLKALSFASEILVIDSGSTDDTLKIAKHFNARVLHHPFLNFADTRNFAQSHAANDWILSLEADVIPPPSLVQEISSLPQTPAVYKLPRLNKIWGKYIRHTDWGPYDDCHIRLYHRSLGRWSGDVHEQFVTKSSAKTLHHPLLHKNYTTVTEFISKLNFYSDVAAGDKQKRGTAFYKEFIWQAKYDFLKRYFYKLGFLDGYRGLFLSYLQAIYYLTLNIKLKTT